MTDNCPKSVQFSESLTATVQYVDEPPDVFNSVDTTQIIESYRRGSLHYNTKPIMSIVQQLSGMRVVDGRCSVLSLSNLRLTFNQVEAMEEIFRRVRFGLIDMEGTQFEEEAAISLFEIIQFYDSANKLNLTSVRGLGCRSWISLMKMLRRTPCISHLDLSCSIIDHGLTSLTRAFRYGSNVSVLHLENTGMCGLNLSELVNGLRNNPCLRELYLCNNCIGLDDVAYLKYLMSGQIKLRLLDLNGNDLRDGGLSSLVVGLGDSLCHLHLNSNHLTSRGMVPLSSFLEQSPLKCLTLSNNNIGDEGLSALKIGLFNCKRLKRLELRNCGQITEGIIALSEFMADSRTITQIDLRCNNLKSAAFLALICSLKINRSLHQLLLDSITTDLYDLSVPSIIESLLSRNRNEPFCDESDSVVSYDTSSLVEYSGALAAVTSTGNFIVSASSRVLKSIKGLIFGSSKNRHDSAKDYKGVEDGSLEFGSVELEESFQGDTVNVECQIPQNNF